jgi:hypothetical protein
MGLVTGRVLSGGAPVERATVALWAATAVAPVQLGRAVTGADGGFTIDSAAASAKDASLYLIAEGGKSSADKTGGDNDRMALMTVLGSGPPSSVVINELTTIASVWTHAQFVDGTAIKGHALGLRIAAGNVPNLVDLATGGLGPVIQDPLNSSQTTTLATFNTLANLLAGALTRARGDACDEFFAAAMPPGGTAPTDTLTAAQNVARYPSHHAQELFALLDEFYPVPEGALWRDVPFVPYLSFAPSAWTLSLVYAGGGLNSLGGIAIDGEGNMWSDNNFLGGAQSTIWGQFGGGVSKIAPNGRPLSPMTVGFRGGGIDGPGFGIAIGADDKVWATSLRAKTISVFDRKTGEPLSPETGYDFGGRLGSMQGIITTPNGDVWALDNEESQIVHLPGGDAAKGRILGRIVDDKPVDGTLEVKGPFHLAVDQQDRIWVTNSSDTVTRFPADDPGKAEQIKVGSSRAAWPSTASATPGSPTASAIPARGRSWRWSRTCSNRRLKATEVRRQRPTTRLRCGSTCSTPWPNIPAATFRWCGRTARSCRRLVAGTASMGPGASPSTATTTSGWPTRLAARSYNSAARVSRTARPAQRPATRSHPPAATSAGCKSSPTSPSTPPATCGSRTTGTDRTKASRKSPIRRYPPASAATAPWSSSAWRSRSRLR